MATEAQTGLEPGVLGNSIFRNKSRPTATAGSDVAPALSRKVKFYISQISAVNTKEDTHALAAIVASCGTSASNNPDEWATMIGSLALILFPGLKDKMGSSVEILEFPESFMANIRGLGDVLNDLDDMEQAEQKDEAGIAAIKERLLEIKLPKEFPKASKPVGTWILESNSTEALYGFLSLVAFLAGKTITDANRSAIDVKRPTAIERKYYLSNVPILTGDMKMSIAAHRGINYGWTLCSPLRKAFFTMAATFGSAEGDPAKEVVWVTVKLMKNAGMQHAQIVSEFLEMYPWAVEVPALRSGWNAFKNSAIQVLKDPEHLQPYHKLIYGDQSPAFNRREMQGLVSVAKTVLEENQPTLSQFWISPDGEPAVRAFMAAKHEKEAAHTA